MNYSESSKIMIQKIILVNEQKWVKLQYVYQSVQKEKQPIFAFGINGELQTQL